VANNDLTRKDYVDVTIANNAPSRALLNATAASALNVNAQHIKLLSYTRASDLRDSAELDISVYSGTDLLASGVLTISPVGSTTKAIFRSYGDVADGGNGAIRPYIYSAGSGSFEVWLQIPASQPAGVVVRYGRLRDIAGTVTNESYVAGSWSTSSPSGANTSIVNHRNTENIGFEVESISLGAGTSGNNWRLLAQGTTLLIQQKQSGTWVTISTFTGA
jgi:hypothetical protein